MKRPIALLLGCIFLAGASLACRLISFAADTPPAVATLGRLYTAAAQTLQAASTPVVIVTPTTTATSLLPTISTGVPSRTDAPIAPCDAATFVGDVTISDGTSLDPGEVFTKTWRIKNIGSCVWTPDYALIFASGDRLGGPITAGLAGSVFPGQVVDLSASMVAPRPNGDYQGFWKLRNAAGNPFGVGAEAKGSFWVKIRVEGVSETPYDFVANYCDARWTNNSSDLPCPGKEGDGKGYVIELKKPMLENGKAEDEAALLMVPKETNNGLISGKYPPVRIRNGDHFQALINCHPDAFSCNVVFTLAYQIEDRKIKNLGDWNEVHEGKFFRVDVDLSSLAGKTVNFILSVSANGSADQDSAIWIAPRISRRTTPPTTTSTATSTPTSTPPPAASSAPKP